MLTRKFKSGKTTEELLEFGIINIDKSSGPTSFNVSDFVRKTLGLRKTSHFGTLDPKVTGVLPIALNRACKLTGFFLGEDKEYVGIMRIHEDVSLEEIKKAIDKNFIGKIIQMPPVKSRVKRQEREREIKKFELLEKDKKDILFIAEVQGGTYIRKLLDDLGKEMGIGAHMLELRRIRAGIFKEETCVDLYKFEEAVKEYKNGNEKLLREIIIPAEIVSEVYPVVEIKKDNLKKIFTGQPIHHNDLVTHHGRTPMRCENLPKQAPKDFQRKSLLMAKTKIKKGESVCVFCEDKFIGMYKIIDGKDIFAKSDFVLQDVQHT